MMKIGVIGAGSWGTALAVLLAKKGCQVILWARRRDACLSMQELRQNSQYLPGVPFPERLVVTDDLEQAVRNAALTVLAVPSHGVRETLTKIHNFLNPETIIVNTAKGIETDTLLRVSQVMMEVLPKTYHDRISTLSGPSHAEEVGRDMPTAVVVASHRRQVAEFVQGVFMSPAFRVYTNPDVVGVELGGALKNIIALGTGIADGLGFGDNPKAALITRGLAEIARLGVAMGAQPLTFAGLAGVGDLVVTCTSMHSRNRRAGMQIGQGIPLVEVLHKMGMVVEGVRTTKAAYYLARNHQVEMPITEQTYKVLFENYSPHRAVTDLMGRGRTHEVEEVVLNWDNW